MEQTFLSQTLFWDCELMPRCDSRLGGSLRRRKVRYWEKKITIEIEVLAKAWKHGKPADEAVWQIFRISFLSGFNPPLAISMMTLKSNMQYQIGPRRRWASFPFFKLSAKFLFVCRIRLFMAKKLKKIEKYWFKILQTVSFPHESEMVEQKFFSNSWLEHNYFSNSNSNKNLALFKLKRVRPTSNMNQ